MSLATTAAPHASASITGSPNPSASLGTSTAAGPPVHLGQLRPRQAAGRGRSRRPARAGRSARAGRPTTRRRPSPAAARAAAARTAATTSSSTSIRFRGMQLPTCSTHGRPASGVQPRQRDRLGRVGGELGRHPERGVDQPRRVDQPEPDQLARRSGAELWNTTAAFCIPVRMRRASARNHRGRGSAAGSSRQRKASRSWQ